MEPMGQVVVRLELPVDPTLVRLARLTVSGVASTLGMDIEDAERCRAAIDELCSSLVEVADDGGRLVVDVRADGPCLTVRGEVARDPAKSAEERRQALSLLIVESEVDAYELDLAPPVARFWFEKRITDAEGATVR